MSRPTFGQHKFDIGIIIESWRLWEGMKENLDIPHEVVADWRLDTDYFVLQQTSGKKIGVVVAQGASFAVDALERFVGCEAQAVVRIGTCGGISPKVEIGDVVVPYAAIREEGTSEYYLPKQVPALSDYNLTLKIIDEISRATGQKIVPSLSWTTDGRWRQADEKIQEYSDLGVVSVDMETAGLLSAAWRRNTRACSVSIVGDTPIRQLGREFKGVPQSESDWYDKIVGNAAKSWNPIIAAALEFVR